jgi:exopolyphosphatase/guanosine-5'-triphosphate,3'-diphosphate pyrophosphatase
MNNTEINSSKFAAIDIGSNTILMLIAKMNQIGEIEIFEDLHSIARLGEGVDKSGIICDEAIERAKLILLDYKRVCDKHNIKDIKICATSAMRDADNSSEVAQILSAAIGAKVEVISGELEAELCYLGSAELSPCSIIDIGGGSVEYMSGENLELKYKISLNIGAVRTTERFFSQRPPLADEIIKVEEYLKSELSALDISKFKGELVAVAGAPIAVAAVAKNIKGYDRNAFHNLKLSRHDIENALDIFKTQTVQEIVERYGLHPNRADIICAGAIILKITLELLNLEYLIVSANGLRFGILKALLNQYK